MFLQKFAVRYELRKNLRSQKLSAKWRSISGNSVNQHAQHKKTQNTEKKPSTYNRECTLGFHSIPKC